MPIIYALGILLLFLFPQCKQHSVTPKHSQQQETSFIPSLPSPEEPIQTQAQETVLPTMPTSQPPSELETSSTQKEQEDENTTAPTYKITKRHVKTETYDSDNPKELDFDVENKTGQTVYVTCFAYQRKRYFGNWRWDKSPVYIIEDNQTVTMDVDTIPDEQDRNYVFGYLGIFKDKKSAEDATYELSDDRNLLDLDQLIKLKGKKVTLEIEHYGFKGEFFEYDFVPKKEVEAEAPYELDFAVENTTGKPIIVTCFVYQKKAKGDWVAATESKDDMTVWRYDKTPLIRLEPGEIGIVDIDPIVTKRDREYVRGYLAVFDEDEEDLAINCTYETLDTRYKLNLGELFRLKNTKIIVDVEKYGIMQDFLDFVPKEASDIDFTKIYTHESKGVKHRMAEKK